MVRELFDIRVNLGDAAELSANILLPPEGEKPTPAVVSLTPYRKDDLLSVAFDTQADRYFAENGYASVHVDLRGFGASSGSAQDFASPQDGSDAAELVEWVGSQEWCDGNVGMWGHSYGGMTALKAAAEAPAHLKAIVPMMTGNAMYEDWLFPGGCRSMLGTGVWASMMTAMQLLPPMQLDVEGDSWTLWTDRLGSVSPYELAWESHPDRDDYWEKHSVEANRVAVPALFMGGWRDIIPTGLIEAFEGALGPKRLIMGPWPHAHPHVASNEPVDQLAEMLKWWQLWLNEAGSPSAPSSSPVIFFSQGDNRWLETDNWPPPRATEASLWLAASGTLTSNPPESTSEVAYSVDPTVGTTAGLWDPLSIGAGLPLDQGPDDLLSLSFTTDPLVTDLRITGAAELNLYVDLVHGDTFQLGAKLCDVARDGTSTLITSGCLSARHRHSLSDPMSVPHHEIVRYKFSLDPTAYMVGTGHRLRLCISGGDFPRLWPTRNNAVFRVVAGPEQEPTIRIPVLPETAANAASPAPPAPRPQLEGTNIIEFEPRWQVSRDEVAQESSVSTGARLAFNTPSGTARVDLDLQGRACVRKANPDGARFEGHAKVRAQTARGALVQVSVENRQTHFGTTARGVVEIDQLRVFERTWSARRLRGGSEIPSESSDLYDRSPPTIEPSDG